MNALQKALYTVDFNRAKKAGYIRMLVVAANKYGVPPELAVALASRETNIKNILGDKKRGIGVVQVDRRYHSLAAKMYADGSWQTKPEALIDYGIKYYAGLLSWASKKYPQYNHRKIGTSAYNAGEGGAEHGVAAGDSDAFTTAPPYAKDVLDRAELFKVLLAKAPA